MKLAVNNFLETYLKCHFHNFHFYLRMNGDVLKITFVGLEIDCRGKKTVMCAFQLSEIEE